MNPTKIVIHEMKGERQLVVFKFLAECVCETGKSPVAHAKRQILAFNEAGRNQIDVRLAADTPLSRSNTLRR